MRSHRREFLKRSLGLSTLAAFGPGAPWFLARSALAAAPRYADRGTVLVVLQLAGGNDGLNTVVPYEDDEYAKARPTLRLPTNTLHKIDAQLGFHPKLRAFHRLYREGLLSVVQGVGYPNPHQGHFESMHIWQTAMLNYREAQTGWIGRAVDWACQDAEGTMPAAFVGQLQKPFALNAEHAIIPSLRTLSDALLREMPQGAGAGQRRPGIEAARAPGSAHEDDLLAFVRRITLASCAQSDKLSALAEARGGGSGGYPPFQLATQLRTIAQLVRAELGIRIFYTELGGQEPGGFDTHAGQAANHGALLEQLSESVAAFLDDLQCDRLLDRVLVMTFSEFGRTVAENGRRGTDHGSAAPIFLAGGRLRGGLVGQHPSLTDRENGGQRHHTDFRRVYATVLERWLGFESLPVLGQPFEPLDVIRG
jgi:uncharacterized protein (DUF1501 family)